MTNPNQGSISTEDSKSTEEIESTKRNFHQKQGTRYARWASYGSPPANFRAPVLRCLLPSGDAAPGYALPQGPAAALPVHLPIR